MRHTNDLGKDPIFPLVLRLAIPTMLAQFVSVLYSIVDRMYIGAGVGSLALAGVGVCAPIVTLLSSFASLIGLGGSPIMAMRMGAGDKREAQKILNNSFFMLLVTSVLLTFGFLALKEKFLMWFGASQATFPYANTYVTIYTLGTVFALLSTGMNSFLIAQGFSGLGMVTVMLGAVLNIVLDPVFIFGFHMGVAGAAVATVLSQLASAVFVLVSLRGKRMPIRLGWGGFAKQTMRKIISFGFSPFLIIASDSILLIVLNTVLQRYGGPGEGDILVTCATIVQSYLLLITMPMSGITLGSQPVVSFNYGRGDAGRIRKAIWCITGLCVLFCSLMMVFTYTLSPFYVGMFTKDAAIRALYQDIYSYDCAPGGTVSAGGRDDGSRSCKAGAVLLSLPEADLFFRTAFTSQAGIRRGGLFLRAHCGYSGRHHDDGSVFKNLPGDCAGNRNET